MDNPSEPWPTAVEGQRRAWWYLQAATANCAAAAWRPRWSFVAAWSTVIGSRSKLDHLFDY